MVGRLPERCRVVATASDDGWFSRQSSRRRRVGHTPPPCRKCRMREAEKAPPARMLSRLLLSERDHLTKGDAITVARIERGVPALATARDLVERFHRMVRERDPSGLPI